MESPEAFRMNPDPYVGTSCGCAAQVGVTANLGNPLDD